MLIKGIAYWAALAEPNNMSSKYEVKIGQLDDKTIKELEDNGVTVKTDPKGVMGSYINPKSKVQPRLVDSKKNTLDPNKVLVGNGSKILCSINTYEWTFKNKSGVGLGLNGVMILDLKERSGADPFGNLSPEDNDEYKDGFVYSSDDSEF